MTALATYRDIAITTAASTLSICLAYALATAHKDLAAGHAQQDAWASQHAEEHAELLENLARQRAHAQAEHDAIMTQLTASHA